MLIKVTTNYGHAVRGRIILKTRASEPFDIDTEKGRELIARGIAVEIEGKTELEGAADDAARLSDKPTEKLEVKRGNVDVVGAQAAPATETAQTAKQEEPEGGANLEEKSIKELRAMAKERGLKGYTSRTKAALIKAILKHDEQQETPQFDATEATV